MFYKEFTLNLFSKMINGFSSHKIKGSKFFHIIFKVFHSLAPPTILNVHLNPHRNNCQKHSYHIHLASMTYSSCWFPLSEITDFQTTNTCKIPFNLYQLHYESTQKCLISAILELNSPCPAFPYYLVPLSQHWSEIKVPVAAYSSSKNLSLWASYYPT